MLGRCIQECYDGPTGVKYYPDGGVNKDGVFDVDPLSPIAQYFEFPAGTKKYQKIAGDRKGGKQPVETTVIEGGIAPESEGPTKKELQAQLDEAGIKYTANMNKTELAALLLKE